MLCDTGRADDARPPLCRQTGYEVSRAIDYERVCEGATRFCVAGVLAAHRLPHVHDCDNRVSGSSTHTAV